jgi:transcriptional regulator GlxA family with amidase domain
MGFDIRNSIVNASIVKRTARGYNVIYMRISANSPASNHSHPIRQYCVAILVFEQAQMLDIAGPADVFAMANRFDATVRYSVACVSKHGGAVALANGLSMQTQSIAQIRWSTIDILIVAGAEQNGLLAAMQDAALKEWVIKLARKASRVASVCVGSFALAHWGLLDGRRATSHWAAVDRLQKNYPSVKVDRHAIFVQDGKIWTAGGVTTGIDLALAMVEADTSRTVAGQIAGMLVMSHRRLGNQAQHSTELLAQSGRYAVLVDWMKENLADSLSVSSLAAQANESERSFCRRFASEVGQTPGQFVEELRLAKAKRTLQGGVSVKAAAKLAGFTSQEHLSRVFRRQMNMTPGSYRDLYAKT